MSWITAGSFLGGMVGLIVQILVAHRFGLTQETDAYFVAVDTGALLLKLVQSEALSLVFLPLFVSLILTGGQNAAWRTGGAFLATVTLVGSSLTLVLCISAPAVVEVIVPGFPREAKAMVVRFLWVFLPTAALTLSSNICIAMLNGLKLFAVPMVAKILPSIAALVGIFALSAQFGIMGVAFGTLIGTALQLVILYASLLRAGMPVGFSRPLKDPRIRQMLITLIPFSLLALTSQVNQVVIKGLASTLSTGAISALIYANSTSLRIESALMSGLTTVLLPVLSYEIAAAQHDRAEALLLNALRMSAFIVLPVSVLAVVLRVSLLRLLFGHGAFDWNAIVLTAGASMFLLLRPFFNIGMTVFGRFLYAAGRTRQIIATTVVFQMLSIVLAVVLVRPMGVQGLALTNTVTSVIAMGLAGWFVFPEKRKFIAIMFDRHVCSCAMLSLLMGFLCYFVDRTWMGPNSTAGTGYDIMRVLVVSALGSGVYLGAGAMTGMKPLAFLEAISPGGSLKPKSASPSIIGEP